MNKTNYYDIYICYPRYDKDEIMPYINEIRSWEVNKNRVSCFYDDVSIPTGANWINTLNEAIFNSRNFIIFVTENWIKSEWLHYEIALSTWRKTKDNDIGIYTLCFPKADIPKIIEDFPLQYSTLKRREEIEIIRKDVGSQLKASFPSHSDLSRSDYLKANANIRPETLSDKIIVSKEAVVKLQSMVVMNSIETNINNLNEKGFLVLLDWLRYLRYDGRWSDALNIMEKALDNNRLPNNSVLLFWLELEYFILRYEFGGDNFHSSLKKSTIFNTTLKKFDENIENIISVIVLKLRELGHKKDPEELWLKTIGLKALGNIYKEINKGKIQEARSLCLEALECAEEIENKFRSFLDSDDNYRVLKFDCYRELGNLELYAEEYHEALNYFRQSLNEIKPIENKQLKDSLLSLLFYHWGRLLIKVGINIPYAAFLLEHSRMMFEDSKIPRNNVRLASILSQLGRLIPKMKNENEILGTEKRSLKQSIKQDVNGIESIDENLINRYINKYSVLNQSNLLKEAKEYLKAAKEINRETGHLYTMVKNLFHLIELNLAIMLHSKDYSDNLEVLSDSQNTFEEFEEFYPINRVNRNTEDYYSQSDELKRKLLDIYSMGIYICTQLSQVEFERELKRKYKSYFY